MSLFTALTGSLTEGSGLSFTIEALKGGELSVLVIPRLDGEPENMSDEVARFRAALSVPLRIVGHANDLDRDFFGELSRYHQARGEAVVAMDSVAKINEATKQAKASKSATTTSAKADSAKSAPIVPQPESMVGASNPDSFI